MLYKPHLLLGAHANQHKNSFITFSRNLESFNRIAQNLSHMSNMALIICLAFSLLLQGALSEFVCEDLPFGFCSFAVASSGKRCSLETKASSSSSSDDETVALECKTSDVVAGNHLHERIESDECLMACGLERKSVGISSDNLLQSGFIAKLCSPQCYRNCLNIVDLYHNLALGEGVYLPNLCKKMEKSPRRAMATTNVLSSGAASATVFDVSEDAQSPATN